MTDSIDAQTKTVTDLGTKQSKVTKEISKALETQNSQQKDANTTLAEQKKIMQEQEAEIKKVTKAVDSQTGVLQKNASGWKMLMTGFAIKFVSEIVDGFKSIISTGLEASRVYEDMSARLTPLVGDLETAQKTFWSLNGLEDETATATDKPAKAFVDLGNNGLTNSNEQLKTYAVIAHDFKKKYPLANEFNAIWFKPGYKEMAPLMVHYLSFEKTWNKFIYLDFRAYAWWKKYLSACERVEGYLDRDFIGRVRSNVNRVK